jgi:hypothetical protein
MNESTNYYGQSGTAESGRQVVDNLKSKVSEAVEPVKEKAAQAAREQKDAGATHLQMAAQAVHGAAREFESQMPKVADLIHNAGDHLDKMATNIRDKSLEEVFNSIRDFARQQPTLVFGGAILAGLLLTRFLKSSTSGNASQRDYYGAAEQDYYKSGQSVSTAPQGDYGVAAGRHYNEETSQTSRPN